MAREGTLAPPALAKPWHYRSFGSVQIRRLTERGGARSVSRNNVHNAAAGLRHRRAPKVNQDTAAGGTEKKFFIFSACLVDLGQTKLLPAYEMSSL
jgi:hypothetical protein